MVHDSNSHTVDCSHHHYEATASALTQCFWPWIQLYLTAESQLLPWVRLGFCPMLGSWFGNRSGVAAHLSPSALPTFLLCVVEGRQPTEGPAFPLAHETPMSPSLLGEGCSGPLPWSSQVYHALGIHWWIRHRPWETFRGRSHTTAAAAAKSLQLCLTLCDPTDRSPPGSPVPGILQARTLEWVAISFSNARKRKWKGSCSIVWLSATPWTAAYQVPPSMGFSRQEDWGGVPLPSPEVTLENSTSPLMQPLFCVVGAVGHRAPPQSSLPEEVIQATYRLHRR